MKRLLKILANRSAQVAMAPLALVYAMLASILGATRCFEGFSQLVALLPGYSGAYLRRAFYRWILPQVGQDAWIGFGVLLTSPQTHLGQRVYIGPYSVLGEVVLEDDVLVASHVSIINGGAQHGRPHQGESFRDQTGEFPPVTIGRGAWLGERAVVMASVGADTVVGAGAVVTKALPNDCVAVGVPAQIVREKSEDRQAMPCRSSKSVTADSLLSTSVKS